MASIRAPRPADAPALAQLLGELGYPAADDAVAERLAAVEAAGARVLVAEHEGRVAGVAVVHRLVTLHRPAPVAWLSALVVGERCRGAGIGRALVEAAAAQGGQWGCHALELTSNDRREEAHRFYQRLGFTSPSRKFRRPIP